MYQIAAAILELGAILWLFYELHKHNHKIGNWLRAVALMLLISHCGLLIFDKENEHARRIPSSIFHSGR